MFGTNGASRRMSISACSIIVAAQFISGCVALTPEQEAQLNRDATQLVTCTKGEDCDVKWGRAITWISRNSQWKIQLQNDSMIQTYTPIGQSASSGFLVNKVPQGNGVYEITMTSACDNIIGCIPDARELKASFNRFVMGASPQR